MPDASRETPFPALDTERLRLRPIGRGDLPFVLQHFLDPAVQRFLLDDEPIQTAEQAAAILDFYLSAPQPTYNRWVIMRRHDCRPIGTCGFHRWSRQHHRAEVGYDLGPAFQGQGYMTEALAAMVAHGFAQLGLHRIEAIVAPENTRSAALLTRSGFQCEGTLRDYFYSGGRYHDHLLFARLGTLSKNAQY
jgi:[ribosomal protein S5]-alanine N-acetyltransferase